MPLQQTLVGLVAVNLVLMVFINNSRLNQFQCWTVVLVRYPILLMIRIDHIDFQWQKETTQQSKLAWVTTTLVKR
jgi:hypothetical protein